MKQLAASCSKQGKWDEAEQLFLELLDSLATGFNQAFEITHSLMEVYLAKRRTKLDGTEGNEGRAKLLPEANVTIEVTDAFGWTVLRPGEKASHIAYIGAGGYGEIHSVNPPRSMVVAMLTDIIGSRFNNASG
jgi:pentatricopeptide repeat protein